MQITICSLCLRVRRGKTWVDAGRVIREIHSYELPDLPRLKGSVCDACADEIFRRRAENEPPLAA